MARYFDIACEVENLVDNALNRCFQLSEGARAVRRVLDHTTYLLQELSINKDALLRCEVHSYHIDRNVEHCQQILRDHRFILEDILNSRSPDLALDTLAPDVADIRVRLDAAHESLTQAIDDFQDGPRRPLMPRQISYQDYDAVALREQPRSPTLVISPNGPRRRFPPQFQEFGGAYPPAGAYQPGIPRVSLNIQLDPPANVYDEFEGPSIRSAAATRRQNVRFLDLQEERRVDWDDGPRYSGYRHVR